MLPFIIAVILFILADFLIRTIIKKSTERRIQKEREKALDVSLKIDFTHEAKTLKRAEVENPKAKILAVDDEEIILSSFRKILVLDGYSVDTVETGQEALGLIQTHHYDFVFTDLKMPEMDGVEVCKSVKQMRPDIDVIIITGYASVDTAVETMKYGAMDYVQKPFSEDELLKFVSTAYFKRQEKIKAELKPKVNIAHVEDLETHGFSEFAIPGGVFISKGHCWASLEQDGTVKIGIDDFAKKIIGPFDDIDLPNRGMNVSKGQPLFRIIQGNRSITFNSPVSGKVAKINNKLLQNIDLLNVTPYEKNWLCVIDADNLHKDISELTIGKTAVTFYQNEIEHYKETMTKLIKGQEEKTEDELFIGKLQKLDDKDWENVVKEFFGR